MTGSELRAIRQQLGLSLVGMGRALGYQGSPKTLNAQEVRVRREGHTAMDRQVGGLL